MSLVNTETVESDVLNYEIHPVAALFPFIEGAAFSEFVEDIKVNGQREPVVLDGAGRLLDGHPFYIATSPTPAATLPQPLPGAGETT